MDLAAFGLFLPEMNSSRSMHPGSGLRSRISVPSTIPVRTVRSEAFDDLGERSQPDIGGDGAAGLLGQQGAYFTDCARDGGAVCTKPTGRYVVGRAVEGVGKGRQQAVDEGQLVLRSGIHRSATGP